MSTPTYHLWVMASGDTHERLAAIIRRLAHELGTPVFEPHVTLLADLQGGEHEHVEHAVTLAGRLQPTRIILTEPSYTDEFFQCLFMRVDSTPDVMRLRELATTTFGREREPFMPHLSLVYGSFDETRKRDVIRRLPPEVQGSFVAETLHVIKADSMAPADWNEIARFPFSGPGVG